MVSHPRIALGLPPTLASFSGDRCHVDPRDNSFKLRPRRRITLENLRIEGSIPEDIGYDLSLSAIWRPKANQNIVFRLSGAALVAGDGFRDLFDNRGNQDEYYSVLANVTLTY